VYSQFMTLCYYFENFPPLVQILWKSLMIEFIFLIDENVLIILNEKIFAA
jgi:hypothetical protein